MGLDTIFSENNIGRFGNTKIVAIRNENTGPSKARNIGIQYMMDDTDVYAILDSDDEMYENKISECIPIFENDEMIGVVYADYDTFHTSTGKIIREYKEHFSKYRERILAIII